MISLTSPVETRAHGWPAGVKLGLLCVSTVLLVQITWLPLQVLCFVGMLALFALPERLFFTTGMKRLSALWPFLLVLGLWHFIAGDPAQGARTVLRLLTAVGLANLVTMTTRLSDMIAVLRWLAQPLARLGLKPDQLALAMALVIRFIPVLAEKGRLLTLSWAARSRRRAGWRILLPFFVLAVDDAEQVAEALRARGGL